GASPALTERGRKLSAQAGSGSRARQGATRGAEQLAIEDLGDQMIGHALQILIRGGSLRRRGLTHEERLAPRGASVLNPAYDHIKPEFWPNSGASGCKVRLTTFAKATVVAVALAKAEAGHYLGLCRRSCSFGGFMRSHLIRRTLVTLTGV